MEPRPAGGEWRSRPMENPYRRAHEEEDAEKGNVAHGDGHCHDNGSHVVRPLGDESHVGKEQAGLEAPDAHNIAGVKADRSAYMPSRTRGGGEASETYNGAPMYCTCEAISTSAYWQ